MSLLRRCLDGTGLVRGAYRAIPGHNVPAANLGLAMGCHPCPSGPPECDDRCLGGTVKETALITFSDLVACDCPAWAPYGSWTVPPSAVLSGMWAVPRVPGTCRYELEYQIPFEGPGGNLWPIRFHQFNYECSTAGTSGSKQLHILLDAGHLIASLTLGRTVGLFEGWATWGGTPPADCAQPLYMSNELTSCNPGQFNGGINRDGTATVLFA